MSANFKYPIGATVEWESQSQGSTKVKRGTVIAHVPAGVNIRKVKGYPKDAKRSHLNFQSTSLVDRYLVAVQVRNHVEYYAPRKSVVDKD